MLNTNWDLKLKEEYQKEYFLNLQSKVRESYQNTIVYPESPYVFRVFKTVDYNQVKVVILGQDPYHGEGEAHGFAFSVDSHIKMPPSLRNIFKELYDDLGIGRNNTNLEDWVKQGVFLLNCILTVEKDKPLSHKGYGWEMFTNSVIQTLNKREEPVVFVLWGNYAKSKKVMITNPKHLVLESAHPSPLSVRHGFFGSKPFSKINQFLEKNKQNKIVW